jgi:hypothetical protein
MQRSSKHADRPATAVSEGLTPLRAKCLPLPLPSFGRKNQAQTHYYANPIPKYLLTLYLARAITSQARQVATAAAGVRAGNQAQEKQAIG